MHEGSVLGCASAPASRGTLGGSQVRTSLFPTPGNSLHIFHCRRITRAAHKWGLIPLLVSHRRNAPSRPVVCCVGLSSGLLEPGDISALLQVPNALIVILFWEKATLAVGLCGGLFFLSV